MFCVYNSLLLSVWAWCVSRCVGVSVCVCVLCVYSALMKDGEDLGTCLCVCVCVVCVSFV